MARRWKLLGVGGVIAGSLLFAGTTFGQNDGGANERVDLPLGKPDYSITTVTLEDRLDVVSTVIEEVTQPAPPPIGGVQQPPPDPEPVAQPNPDPEPDPFDDIFIDPWGGGGDGGGGGGN